MGAAVFVAGLFVTFTLAARVIHDAEGYDPGAADCDDCGVTLLLDNIGWLALAAGAYLTLAYLAVLVLRQVKGIRRSA